jgi:hypothetical protein
MLSPHSNKRKRSDSEEVENDRHVPTLPSPSTVDYFSKESSSSEAVGVSTKHQVLEENNVEYDEGYNSTELWDLSSDAGSSFSKVKDIETGTKSWGKQLTQRKVRKDQK